MKISKQAYQGGEFNGNSCRILLKSVDKLQRIVEERSCVPCIPFIELLRTFNKIVSSSF